MKTLLLHAMMSRYYFNDEEELTSQSYRCFCTPKQPQVLSKSNQHACTNSRFMSRSNCSRLSKDVRCNDRLASRNRRRELVRRLYGLQIPVQLVRQFLFYTQDVQIGRLKSCTEDKGQFHALSPVYHELACVARLKVTSAPE